MDYAELASILVTVVGAVGGAYLKLRDQLTELKADNKAASEARLRMETEINIIQRDIHNLALMIGTARAKSEESAKKNNGDTDV